MGQKARYIPAMLDVDKIKALREKAGLTQESAAKAAGKASRQWWNNIESGKQHNIGLSTLNEIAQVLKTTARDLLK